MIPLRIISVAAKPGLAIGMEEEDGEEAVRRAWLRWLGVGTGSLALLLAGLWTQRAPIAENFVTRELNRRGVQARYDLVDVGLRTQYDTCELVAKGSSRQPLFIDQGEADNFLAEQLKPERLEAVCEEHDHPLTLRRHPGYDHSYFFIASFIDDHLSYHAERLYAKR